MEIKKTKEYSLFNKIKGNRSLNLKKIAVICEDIEKGLNLLPYYPIVVSSLNEGFSVIDGQHRLAVSMELGLEVYYVECETLSLSQIAQLNSRGQKWSINDFLNCYADLGVSDYVTLKELSTKYKLSVATMGSFLMFYVAKSDFKEKFQSGNFRVNHLAQTLEILDLCEKLFGVYRFSKDRYLIEAVKKIKEKGLCDFSKLAEKIKASPTMMDKQGDAKNYIYNIERVYNFKNSKRETLI